MRKVLLVAAACLLVSSARSPHAQSALAALPDIGPARTITQAECTSERLGATIPVGAIGEPVSGVSVAAPVWTAATESAPAYCSVDGALAPVTPDAKPINFRVVFPASWSLRAAHLGGGGMNGAIPGLTGGRGGGVSPAQGFVTFGSDSGHRMADPPSWSLSDEAIKNLGYLQMKKTRDAAMVLVERMYGQRPKVSYYIGTSQGGREALTVAERYPDDYDGVIANVPIVHFSSLMLAAELIRIQEKPIPNWVTRAKVEAIRSEFLRQCDRLDGLVDGIINNYMACRAIFDVKQGAKGRQPWASKRCPNNSDPDPANTSATACLTDGQISTLEFVYSRYRFAAPLANKVTTFGMWLPNTDPSGSGLIADARFKGQEGATSESPMHRHLGVLGVTGFLMKDPDANPLDYVEGGPLSARRRQLSEWLDSTDPDLSRFARRGGKMIVTIGTDDTLASPGAQLDFYQAVIDAMGRTRVDGFARFFVMPQAGHGLSGRNHSVDGEGKTISVSPIPNGFDRVRLLTDWVERKIAPGASVVVTAGDRSLPLCSYPSYPHYVSGPTSAAPSYECR
ncbi:MAG TPA: tannase/feruloyl esterase family alpha/beta hydrolase [Vicinamibacterales bacterium]